MRIRQVKPEFFKDARLAALSPAVRLFYIGLWMVADDAGWFRADVAELGNELFGYEPRVRREKAVEADLKVLSENGRILRFACGHANVPRLSDHQRLAGETKRVYSVQKEHSQCPRELAGRRVQPAGIGGPSTNEPIPATPRVSPRIPDTVRLGTERLGNGQERNVDAPADAPDGAGAPSEFQDKVPRLVALGQS